MKISDEVAVVCDHRTDESALALRGVLEHFRLRIKLHRLVDYREALDFFAGRGPTCPYTVLMSMATTGQESPGSGTFLDSFEGGLRFEVFETAYGDPDAKIVVERNPAFVDLMPSTIPNLVTATGGTLVAIAGQESLVSPFLENGYSAVIVPSQPSQDYDAALLFTIGFFYFARLEDAGRLDLAGRRVESDEEAVALAAALSSTDIDRTGRFRYYRQAG